MPSNKTPAPWHQDVILWPGKISRDRPWRQQEFLKGRFHPDAHDDLEVLFPNLAGGTDERMWVTVIGFHADPPEYLAILLNQPDLITGLNMGDNVAFTLTDSSPYPVAIAIDDDYRRAGLPPMSPPAFRVAMADGLNAYRLGAFGHNMPGIEFAMTCFHGARGLIDDSTSDASRFFLHFYLARCDAETYDTLGAIQEFRQAIALRPDDEHAQMGLLAEYSLLAHRRSDRLPAADSEFWAQQFETQVSIVRRRFPPEADANRLIDQLLSGTGSEEELSRLSREERDAIPRIGPGPFRWKSK